MSIWNLSICQKKLVYGGIYKLELIDIKNKLLEFQKTINEIKDTLKIEEKRQVLSDLEQKTMEQGFWDDSKNSGEILKQIKDLKVELASFDKTNDFFEIV